MFGVRLRTDIEIPRNSPIHRVRRSLPDSGPRNAHQLVLHLSLTLGWALGVHAVDTGNMKHSGGSQPNVEITKKYQ